MKHVTICADDYAIAPGVSAAIRRLIEERRINATSVMTVFSGLAEEARRLAETVGGKRVSVGLHITLTGGTAPLTPWTDGGNLPALRELVARAFTGRLDRAAVAAEVEAQFLAFERAFGRPPDHVDGHQHVHVLPVIRAAVLKATHRHAPNAWLRNVEPASAALIGLDIKGRLIGAFGHGFARAAARIGLSTNSAFAGAYDFGADHDFAPLLAHFLKGLPDGGLVMVHPGHVDDPLTARDPLTHQREVEFEVLNGPRMPEILAETDARLF
ncbi:ChbG/HpnK family deacetylase [Xanthobacter variabilis]|uniref:ChbG/HpnK family deacetylase n=1 Tax=Xanthobacter variabilis TaxID=3119932 RepID=UPI00374E80CA